MDLRLEDRRTLITGASGGIGRAVVQMLAHEGADLFLTARNQGRLIQVATMVESIAGSAPGLLTADLANEKEVARLADAVTDHFEELDLFINCSAAPVQSDFASFHPVDLSEAFNVKVIGPLALIRRLAHHFASGSAIVLVAGMAAHYATSENLVTGCVNAAVLAATRSLANVFAPDIRVTAVSPGPTRTGRWDEFVSSIEGERGANDAEEKIVSESLIGRIASADEVATTVVLASSPVSGLLMGSELLADGGRRL